MERAIPSGKHNNRQQQQLYDYGGRQLPRDTDLEEAVLGALMLEKDAYTSVCDILKAESFYEPANRKIYEAIQTLGASQQPIDMLTVTEQLRLNGTLDEVGETCFCFGTDFACGIWSSCRIPCAYRRTEISCP